MTEMTMNVSIDSNELRQTTQLVMAFDKWKRMTKMVTHDPTKYHANQVLPIDLRVPSSGTHFYKMGFSNFKNGCTKRHWIYHPFLVFIVPTLNILRFIYSIRTPNLNPIQYLYIGDFGYFMDMRIHLNLTAALVFWMGVASQLIHLYNYMTSKKPIYMRVFEMMAGKVTPCSINMTDEHSVRKLVKVTKIIFKCSRLMLQSMTFSGSFICFTAIAVRNELMDVVLIGIPHTIFFGFGVHYVMNALCTQIFYFYILAYYLRLKQRDVNDYMRHAIHNKKDMKIMSSKRVTDPLNSIYLEIMEYDSNFWSKFIGVVWSTCTTVVALVIFMFAFGNENMHINIRLILFYAIFFYSLLLYFVVYTSASVNLQVETAYKLLASYKLVTMKTEQSRPTMARHGLKILNLFERIGQKDEETIGFSCFGLFVINFFRGYEIVGLCGVVLLKIIQMEKNRKETLMA